MQAIISEFYHEDGQAEREDDEVESRLFMSAVIERYRRREERRRSLDRYLSGEYLQEKGNSIS